MNQTLADYLPDTITMPQQFNLPESAPHFQTPPVLQNAERENGLASDPTSNPIFAALSVEGQNAVSGYMAHIQSDPAKGTAFSSLSPFEQAKTLDELRDHLLFLIAAYIELCGDEKRAIAAAIPQRGSVKNMSGGLRRVKTGASGFPFDIAVPMALFTLAMLMPFLLPVGTQQSGLAQFGWPGLFLLPFAAGAFAASRKEEGAWRTVLAAIGLVIASTFLMGFVLMERIQTIHEIFSVSLRPALSLALVWSLSAGAGWVALRHLKAITHKQNAE